MLTLTIPLPTVSLLASLDALADIDVAGPSGAEQADLLRVLGRVDAKVSAVRLRVLAAAEKSGTPQACGAAGTGQWAAAVTSYFHHQRIHDTDFRHRYLPDGTIRFSRRT